MSTRTWIDHILIPFLAQSQSFQGFAFAISLLGLCWSLGVTLEAWKDWQAVRANGASVIRKLHAFQLLRTQAIIAFVQICFACITLAVMTLPPVPTYGIMQANILLVIGVRKFLRLLMVLALTYQSWSARMTYWRIWAYVEQELDTDAMIHAAHRAPSSHGAPPPHHGRS